MNANYKPLTAEQEKLLLENYLKVPLKRLAREIGIGATKIRNEIQRRNLIVPPEVAAKHRASTHYKKGRVPENKGLKQKDYMSAEAIQRTKATRFKKGITPPNTLYDGAISRRKDKNGKVYKYIRVSKSNWKLLHQKVWEETNGKIPSGKVLWFKDGNSENCTLENLELITREESMYRNSVRNYPREVIPSLLVLNKLNKKIKQINNG